MDDKGKETIKVISNRERKKFFSKKANKGFIAKTVIKTLKLKIKIS